MLIVQIGIHVIKTKRLNFYYMGNLEKQKVLPSLHSMFYLKFPMII